MSQPEKKKSRTKKALAAVGAVGLIGAVGTAVWYYGFRKTPTVAAVAADVVAKKPDEAEPKTATEKDLVSELAAIDGGVDFKQIADVPEEKLKLLNSKEADRIVNLVGYSITKSCKANYDGAVVLEGGGVYYVRWICDNDPNQPYLWATSNPNAATKWADTFNKLIESKRNTIVATTNAAPSEPSASAATAAFYYKQGYW